MTRWVVPTAAVRTYRLDGTPGVWRDEVVPLHALAEILTPSGPVTPEGAVRLFEAIFGRRPRA